MSGFKRQSLSLQKKVEIIRAVDNAPPSKKKKDIAADFCIPANTLSTILKNRVSILNNDTIGAVDLKRKRFQSSRYEDVDEALLKWFRGARDQKVPVSGPLLLSKAKEFAEKMGNHNFQGSAGWLARFKKRHKVTFRSVSGESASVSQDVVDEWLSETLPQLLQDYSARDIFNADETGLFWRLLPDKTFSFKGDKCHGGKKSKERISLLVCSNMDGSEKLPLLVIGKFAKPRCLKGVNSLPVQYKSNKKAWMVSEIFTEWIKDLDRKFSREKRKVLLFVDNCTAHPIVPDLKSIQLTFLPPNATSCLQPCDQGIICSFKAKYKNKSFSD